MEDTPRLPAIPEGYRWKVEERDGNLGIWIYATLQKSIRRDLIDLLTGVPPRWETVAKAYAPFWPERYRVSGDASSLEEAMFIAATSAYGSAFPKPPVKIDPKYYPPESFTPVDMDTDT